MLFMPTSGKNRKKPMAMINEPRTITLRRPIRSDNRANSGAVMMMAIDNARSKMSASVLS
ncbi:hypothetical protein D3C78_1598850 [compost metagenome]